jgi:hypothetical protein
LSNRLRRGRRGAMSFHSRSPPTMLDRSQNVLKGVSLLLWVGRVCIHTQRLSRTALTSPETIPSGCGKSDALYLVRAMPGYNRSGYLPRLLCASGRSAGKDARRYAVPIPVRLDVEIRNFQSGKEPWRRR